MVMLLRWGHLMDRLSLIQIYEIRVHLILRVMLLLLLVMGHGSHVVSVWIIARSVVLVHLVGGQV